MEDEQKDVKKIIIIITFIIIAILIVIIIINQYNKHEDDRIENLLIKKGYEKVTNKIYQKTSKNNKTTYVYNIVNKDFEKTITDDNQNEIIDLLKNNERISITYSYQDKTCKLSQTAAYEKGKLTECKIEKKTPECTAKCDKILAEAKKFEKEKLQ